MQDNIKQPKDYVSMSTRLPSVDAVKLKLQCKRNNQSPSEFIREIINEKVNESPVSFVAGANKIEYDPKKDSFTWNITEENGNTTQVMDNLSIDFLQQLSGEINIQIRKRNETIGKKSNESVAVPRRLVK